MEGGGAYRHVLTGLDWLKTHKRYLHGENGSQRVDLGRQREGLKLAGPGSSWLPMR